MELNEGKIILLHSFVTHEIINAIPMGGQPRAIRDREETGMRKQISQISMRVRSEALNCDLFNFSKHTVFPKPPLRKSMS